MTARELVVLWIGLSVGNYVYQTFHPSHDWLRATERSFFQGFAVLCVWFHWFINR